MRLLIILATVCTLCNCTRQKQEEFFAPLPSSAPYVLTVDASSTKELVLPLAAPRRIVNTGEGALLIEYDGLTLRYSNFTAGCQDQQVLWTPHSEIRFPQR